MATDARGRTPLFYAAARDHRECVALIADMMPDWINCGDSNSDTALHVAAARGNVQAVSLLLQFGADPNLSNSAGMTPTHVAKNNPILGLLSEYKANVGVVDAKGRSPLFVMSALGRVDAAALLFDLDPSMDTLELADERGDTPVHAAAANGHRPCVKLLLQSAADAQACNSAGLKPSDLARMNGHEACARLLERYVKWLSDPQEFDDTQITPTPTTGGLALAIGVVEAGEASTNERKSANSGRSSVSNGPACLNSP